LTESILVFGRALKGSAKISTDCAAAALVYESISKNWPRPAVGQPGRLNLGNKFPNLEKSFPKVKKRRRKAGRTFLNFRIGFKNLAEPSQVDLPGLGNVLKRPVTCRPGLILNSPLDGNV